MATTTLTSIWMETLINGIDVDIDADGVPIGGTGTRAPTEDWM